MSAIDFYDYQSRQIIFKESRLFILKVHNASGLAMSEGIKNFGFRQKYPKNILDYGEL